jgi:hypothetical protein
MPRLPTADSIHGRPPRTAPAAGADRASGGGPPDVVPARLSQRDPTTEPRSRGMHRVRARSVPG